MKYKLDYKGFMQRFAKTLYVDVATKLLKYNISQLQLPRTATSFHIHKNAAPD